MATITTAITVAADPLLLDINPADPIASRASIEFFSIDTVPAKLTTDVTLYTVTCPLPPNFVYRLIDLTLIVRGTTIGNVNFFEPSFQFQLQNASQDIRTHSVEAQTAFVWNADVTNLATKLYELPSGEMQFPFRSAPAGGELFLRLWDVTAQATTAVSMVFRARFLQYTVEQFNASPMHTPFPVLSL